MPSQYWFWIDTLCCPVDIKEKLIALERIAAVYRNAAHVLALDKSVSPFTSQGKGLARAVENCLRIVGSATWMGRLWTLQGMIRAFFPKVESSKGEPSKADGLIAPQNRKGLGEIALFPVQGQSRRLCSGGRETQAPRIPRSPIQAHLRECGTHGNATTPLPLCRYLARRVTS